MCETCCVVNLVVQTAITIFCLVTGLKDTLSILKRVLLCIDTA